MSYNPNQPRVPAGSGDPSGQWAPASGSTAGSVGVSTGDYSKVRGAVPKGAELQKAITGKSGAKIIGYAWQSRIEDVDSGTAEGVVAKRVSDWDRSDISTGTGREIVHHYYVQHPDGSVTLEGVRSAEKILAGISDDDKKTLSGVTSAIKTVRKWEGEIAAAEEVVRKGDVVIAAVAQLPVPPVVVSEHGWRMGDSAEAWDTSFDSRGQRRAQSERRADEIPEERRKVLVESWRERRVDETLGQGASQKIRSERNNLPNLRDLHKKAVRKVKLFLKD